MSYQLVCAACEITAGAPGAAVTPAWGPGDARPSGYLLQCWVYGLGHSTVPATPDGWAVAAQVAHGSPAFDSATLFYKIAAGEDAAPTIAGIAGITWSAMLASFQSEAAPTPAQLINQALGITLSTGDIIDIYPATQTTSRTVNADGSVS